MTWESVFQRSDIVGGDLETYDLGYVTRGPIATIGQAEHLIVIRRSWVAICEADGTWRAVPDGSVFFEADGSHPSEIQDNRFQFFMPHVGDAVIYLKGGQRLDPADVRGLIL